ncbi:unnamed protein product [Durusdinium trenchii]|uniref:Uncharacterized protein n=1 Tax=Durusdinium trenchii TaxID=1381693 RepID=A0ABP0NA32_9DINO
MKQLVVQRVRLRARAEGRRLLSQSRWPETSGIHEPVWDKQIMQFPLMNMFETYFVLREARQRVLNGSMLHSVNDFNHRFMERFLGFHNEVESMSGKRRSEPGRLEVASLTARAVWLQQRPGSRWELLPHYCQVVQGRRAQHHGQKWLQVTTRLALEERWLSRSKEDLRVREHFVVYELPREGAIVQDFRIAAILPDAEPAKE